LDKAKGLMQFGDEEVYLTILQSYVSHTPDLLDKIRTCAESELPNYAIIAHGIKGTSYAIGADAIGKQAETLEQAARRSDFQYVSENNAGFIEATEQLIDRINTVLREVKNEERD